MDRGHPMLARQADGLHPAVLRMIDQTVRATEGKGTWVGVCGGVAGEPLGAVILIGLGVTELSVSIPSIAAIKARIRNVSMRDARALAQRALACDSAEAVRASGERMSKVAPVVTVTLNPAIDQTLSIPGFAAGQVNRVAGSRSHAGGKGVNVACFLADLGVETGIEVIVTGFLGAGNAGLFVETFAQKGITDRFVRIAGSTRVGIKIVDDRRRQTTDINFPGLTPEGEDIDELLAVGSLRSPCRAAGSC